MHHYFYTNFLDSRISFFDNFASEKAQIQKYLYISTLSRILTSLNATERKGFIAALRTSEEKASSWISGQPAMQQLVKEHIQRTMLSLNV